MGGHIRGYDFPGSSLVGTPVDKLAPVIDGAFVKGILRYGCIPVESLMYEGGGIGWFDLPLFPGIDIVAAKFTALAHGIYPVCIIGIGHHIKSVSAAHFCPVGIP